jgi:hypothetical protein
MRRVKLSEWIICGILIVLGLMGALTGRMYTRTGIPIPLWASHIFIAAGVCLLAYIWLARSKK